METAHQGGMSKQRVMGLVLTGRWLSALYVSLASSAMAQGAYGRNF